MIVIKKITWEQTRDMWGIHMPNMSIEPTSAMTCPKSLEYKSVGDEKHLEQIDTYDLQNQNFTPTFWGAFDNELLIGVNSGHMTLYNLYRSRGLYVEEEYRGHGIGQKLLLKTISQGYFEKAIGVWSYPNRNAWMSYHNTGFILSGEEFNFNWTINEQEQMNSKAVRVFDRKNVNQVFRDVRLESLKKIETEQTNSNCA
jgi:GNAT superfamily N-acetyltransferase